MEGIVQIKTGKLVSLSEQQIVDCDVNGDDHGCQGGLARNAFKFIIENGGLTSADRYPYQGAQGTCDSSASPVATISGYELVPPNDEKSLMQVVANQPVAVSIFASNDFQSYHGGIFNGPCEVNEANHLNHAVTVVGYGTDSGTGLNYWLLKNQWGTGWGEAGYMRMQKDVEDPQGLCGIAIRPVYPTA